MKTYIRITSVYQIETPHPGQDLAKAMEVAEEMHISASPMKFQAGAKILEVGSCREVHRTHGIFALAQSLRDRLHTILGPRKAPWRFAETPGATLPDGWSGDRFITSGDHDWNGELEHQTKPADYMASAEDMAATIEAQASRAADGRSWAILTGPLVETLEIDGCMRFVAWVSICFGPKP